jgi:hypothetical protein
MELEIGKQTWCRVKLSMCHEDVWGVEVQLHAFLTSEVDRESGQLHGPAALPLWKELPVPIEWQAGWTPEPFWT